jgi:hypothetical protein
MYIKINQDGSTVYPYLLGNLKKDFPEVSFTNPVLESSLNRYNVFSIQYGPYPQDFTMFQVIESSQPFLEDGVWKVTFTVRDKNEAEMAELLAEHQREVRSSRDNILKDTVDLLNPIRWEAMTEEQKQAWRDYRQALLDVPQQEGFPYDISWPSKPE